MAKSCLEDRLLELEKRERNNATEIFQLKQQTQELSKQNDDLRDVIQCLTRENTGGAVGGLFNQSSENHDLKKDVAELKNKIDEHILESGQLKDAVENVKNTSSDDHSQMARIQKLFSQIVVESNEKKYEIQQIQFEIQNLKKNIGEEHQSTFVASVKPARRLQVGRETRLDNCVRVFKPSVHFNEDNCMFVSRCDAVFKMGVRFGQRGPGKVKVRLRKVWLNGDRGDVMEGMTDGDGHVFDWFNVVFLSKGMKVWVEGMKVEGEAEVGWCHFSGILVCPS